MIRVWKLPRPFTSDGGAAYLKPLDCQIEAPDLVFLLEDGKTIGRGEALHQDIRDHGGGLVSISNGAVRLSSSDGTDCNMNGRDYEIAVLDKAAFQDIAIKKVGANSESVVKSIAENIGHNNAFFMSFFTYYRTVRACLERNGFEVPSSILEIGCGAKPYVALRFLLEGVARFVANDLFDVQRAFSPEFVSALLTVCDAIDPKLCKNFERVFRLENDRYRLVGLEALGGRSFDQINIEGQVNLIISISALEHVMHPESAVIKMAEILPAGGLMSHSIDFRDHRNFQEPLNFLKLTAEEYAPIATENRLRASDWVAILERNGFEIIERYDQAMTPESVLARDSYAEGTYRLYRAGEKILPSVTEEDRKTYAEPFRQKDLVDLSITSIRLLCRKK